MLRYSSSRHRKLMDASEYALRDASESPRPRESRIAKTILGDSQKYRQWESGHANLLLPVAEQSAKKPQIVALRLAEVQLVHRRAFFDYLHTNHVTGDTRQRLFRLFHTTMDFNDAVLKEHRQYMLAYSSRISTDHIIDVMHDSKSKNLLRQYEKTFARYFEMKCFVASGGDSDIIDIVRTSTKDLRAQLMRIRRRIETEAPVGDGGNFDRAELLSRTARYPITNYLNV